MQVALAQHHGHLSGTDVGGFGNDLLHTQPAIRMMVPQRPAAMIKDAVLAIEPALQ